MDAAGLMIDPGINIAVQHLSPALTIFVIPGEFLDSTPWYLLIISVLCLGFHPRYGVRLAVLIGVTAGLNEALKLAWHLPRPYWISPDVKAFANHPSFGFPSGAAMYGAAAYGYIAAVVRRRRVVAACALLLVSTCFVRVIAGVHFVPDIFGGLLFGFLLLLLFFRAEPWITRYAGTLSRPGRCIWILILSAIPIVLVMPAYNALAGWELPASWAVTAFRQTGSVIAPVTIRYAWGGAGIILGSLAGYEVLLSQGGWEPPAGTGRRCAVILAGSGSVLAAWGIIAIIRARYVLPSPFDQGISVCSMAAVLFWLTCCVPLIARRAGYALEEEHREAGGE